MLSYLTLKKLWNLDIITVRILNLDIIIISYI